MEDGSSHAPPQGPSSDNADASAIATTSKEFTAGQGNLSPTSQERAIPMFDVHTPHDTVHSWKDFFIHIAIITIGLLIAVGIEQTVEAVHHLHQRHQLEHDLHEEAISNREIILHDLKLEDQEKWF